MNICSISCDRCWVRNEPVFDADIPDIPCRPWDYDDDDDEDGD